MILDKPKELVGLDQKVSGWIGCIQYHPARTTFPPADRADLRYSLSNTRNVVAPCHRPLGRITVRHAVGGMGGRERKKRMLSCNGVDTGYSSVRKGADVPTVLRCEKTGGTDFRRESK